MMETGELSTDGYLTILEVLLLKSILVYFIIHGFEVTAHNILYVYNHIYYISRLCDSLEFPLFERDIQYVQRFLSKIFNTLQLLNSLFKFL